MDRSGYIYVIRSTHKNDWYKIGRTNNPSRRFNQLGNSDDIGRFGFVPVLLIQVDDCVKDELYWHQAFGKNRKHGEWFELTENHIQYIVKEYGARSGRLHRQIGRKYHSYSRPNFAYMSYLDRFAKFYDKKILGIYE